MNDKEVVQITQDEKIDFDKVNSNFEKNDDSPESFRNIELKNDPLSVVEISADEIVETIYNHSDDLQESEDTIRSEQIAETPILSDETKKDNPKTTGQLFKLASLIFLLGLALILIALVGLFKSKFSGAAGFVTFMLGLVAVIISAIYTIAGVSKINPDKPRQRDVKRRDFVVFFTLLFVGFALLLINGRV